MRIVALEQLVTDLSRQPAPPLPIGNPYVGARHARTEAMEVGADSPADTDIAETYPVTVQTADPLAAPVEERRGNQPPEVAH